MILRVCEGNQAEDIEPVVPSKTKVNSAWLLIS